MAYLRMTRNNESGNRRPADPGPARAGQPALLRRTGGRVDHAEGSGVEAAWKRRRSGDGSAVRPASASAEMPAGRAGPANGITPVIVPRRIIPRGRSVGPAIPVI